MRRPHNLYARLEGVGSAQTLGRLRTTHIVHQGLCGGGRPSVDPQPGSPGSSKGGQRMR